MSGSSIWWKPKKGKPYYRSSAWPPHHLRTPRFTWSGPDQRAHKERTEWKKTTNRGDSPHVVGNISLLHMLSGRTKIVFVALCSDKEVLSVNLCIDTIKPVRMQGVSAVSHRWWVRLRQCRSLWFQKWFGRLQLVGCQIRPSSRLGLGFVTQQGSF